MPLTATELYASLQGGRPLLVLDVRNQDEFNHWKVEVSRPIEMLNIPYFEFIEAEDASIDKVRRWIGGRGDPLAVVCSKGGSSEYVADVLRAKGIPASNVEGGMIAWGIETVFQPIRTPEPLQAWQFLRFGKGCLSYIVASETDAAVVDPQRKIDVYLEFLKTRGLNLRGVMDTHLHADHLSGASALSKISGAPYYANPHDFEGAAFPYRPIRDRDRIELGKIKIVPLQFLHAPGHTPGSTLLWVNQTLLLTGDTLFIENVGRPDLGGKAGEWSHDLYETLHTRLSGVPDDAIVLPAHTSGPRETKSDGTVQERLGVLRGRHSAFTLDEATFVRRIQESLVPAPPHYAKIRALNAGIGAAAEEEMVEMELGKNECALARR